MSKTLLISIVEDDQFFRESMKRLMRSLGYTVEAFPSPVHLLASPRLAETACLIPTIIVTGYPNDVDRARALNDGVVCYLRKPVDESRLIGCLGAALRSGKTA